MWPAPRRRATRVGEASAWMVDNHDPYYLVITPVRPGSTAAAFFKIVVA